MSKNVLILLFCVSMILAAERYEAENAIVDENSIQKVDDPTASGGVYINMKEGALSFTVSVSTADFYTLWVVYSEPGDTNGKIQNLSVNGVSKGQISFPCTSVFTRLKGSAKIKLVKGANTIQITKSWGWVNIDYVELTPYEETPFKIPEMLVTPDVSDNTKKLYNFIKENFGKKVISGVMTNRVMENDGKNTPMTVQTQEEVAWIISKSGKAPALMGFDFMHGSGKSSDNMWYTGYTAAAIALAEDLYKKGGIPIFCWHWKDPSKSVEAFYSPSSGNTPYVDFNLLKAYKDAPACETFDTESAEYKAIIGDLDQIAGYLKELSNKSVPVLWRPLHEASGKWFWWGYRGAKACRSLYRLMFDRFTKVHHLNNLIWVWTTDEAADALDWYPGNAYVDIVGRDYYYYPREANHGSLVASFEKVKDIFGGEKIITLGENGSIPHPDSMKADDAGWSWFMPWYGDYTMDGWAHDNTADDWKSVMNNDYVITLDKMPGWDNYKLKISAPVQSEKVNKNGITLQVKQGKCVITSAMKGINNIEVYTLQGKRVGSQTTHPGSVSNSIDLGLLTSGTYLVRMVDNNSVRYSQVLVKRMHR
jgi:mannan endo-1,4-beta-mannosidase